MQTRIYFILFVLSLKLDSQHKKLTLTKKHSCFSNLLLNDLLTKKFRLFGAI